MAIDNSTGKDKEFYDLGKKMFDRIQPITRGIPQTPQERYSKRQWVGLTDKEILADDVLRYHFGLPAMTLYGIPHLVATWTLTNTCNLLRLPKKFISKTTRVRNSTTRLAMTSLQVRWQTLTWLLSMTTFSLC